MKRSFGVGGVALVATMTLGTGCGGKRVEAEPQAKRTADVSQYYPLAVGNRWTYRVNGREDKSVTVEILREEGGFFHDNQGGQLAVDGYGLRDPKRYLLRAPVEAGRTWTNVVSVSSTERYHVVQAGVPCEAPAGAFQDCVQVEGRNRVDDKATLVNTMTFAPGVGMVRVEVAVETNGQRMPQTWLELTAFQLGSPTEAPKAPPAG